MLIDDFFEFLSLKWLLGDDQEVVSEAPPRTSPKTDWDPKNWKSGEGASKWTHFENACPSCGSDLDFEQAYQLKCCFLCGDHFNNIPDSLSWRHIFYKNKWRFQIKTRHGSCVRDTLLEEPTGDK
jgi:hypothetical protein